MNTVRHATLRSVAWSSLSVPVAEAEVFAAQLLDLANDSRSWSLANFGATVIRRRMDGADEFLFSPDATATFAGAIEARGGVAHDPPRVRELEAAKTSRMLLGFKTRWEAFQPPRMRALEGRRAPRGGPSGDPSPA